MLNPRANPALLSIVIPCYNEEEVVPLLRREIEAFAATLPCAVEFIFINDGSRDRTLVVLDDWAKTDPRVRLLGFARNFGHQTAVTAGLDVAQGDAVVIMDADLQDPPKVVHEMLARFREGYDVVYGQREERAGETTFKKITAWAFYRLMKKLVHPDLPVDAGDFRLVSRECLNALQSMRETHRFLRGMVAWVGFPQTAVLYKRDARAAGETKYPLRKMLTFAWTAALSFSPLPLRVSLLLGILTALIGFFAGLYALVVAIIHFFFADLGIPYSSGWASIMTLLCLVGGAILVGIGILGEYVARIYDEIKARPLYLVSYRRNVETPSAPR
ncbi:MAG: glycosyltransferase family 2 protein [Betaproteobacteria bacterium]|nr:glycosyltransferase family 2 protein [Betaproteobacteria bacterium]